LAALLLVCAGCGQDSRAEEPDAPGLRSPELEWVADYAAWVSGFLDELSDEESARLTVLGDEDAFRRYAEESERLRSCHARLDDRLDPAPTERLQRTLAGLRDVCTIVAPAVERLVGAVRPDERTGPYLDAGQAVERAHLRWTEVDAALDALLLARGPLPRRGGAVSTSRVEPTLSRVAEHVADGRAAEVRCWSTADWRRVLEEEEAITDGELTVDTVGAFAILVTGTIHLQQDDCALLGRLAYEGRQPRGGDRDDLAYAVTTLSHEIQHLVSPAGEAATECAGMQHAAEVAERLGATRAYAESLAARYWERFYPPPHEAYRSGECRPGGALDLAPETDAWPTG
jgi:hypothetical protein